MSQIRMGPCTVSLFPLAARKLRGSSCAQFHQGSCIPPMLSVLFLWVIDVIAFPSCVNPPIFWKRHQASCRERDEFKCLAGKIHLGYPKCPEWLSTLATLKDSARSPVSGRPSLGPWLYPVSGRMNNWTDTEHQPMRKWVVGGAFTSILALPLAHHPAPPSASLPVF